MSKPIPAPEAGASGCPSWCELPAGHDYDAIHTDGSWIRSHSAPTWRINDHVAVWVSAQDLKAGSQVTELPAVITVDQPPRQDGLRAEEARALAAALVEAAALVDATVRADAPTTCAVPWCENAQTHVDHWGTFAEITEDPKQATGRPTTLQLALNDDPRHGQCAVVSVVVDDEDSAELHLTLDQLEYFTEVAESLVNLARNTAH